MATSSGACCSWQLWWAPAQFATLLLIAAAWNAEEVLLTEIRDALKAR